MLDQNIDFKKCIEVPHGAFYCQQTLFVYQAFDIIVKHFLKISPGIGL